MRSQQRLRVMEGLLALVRASGGRIESRVRIQKEAYLLAAKGSQYFNCGEFVYYYYGPYSRSLSDILHQAVSLGLLREIREDFHDETSRYSYELTEAGDDFLSAVGENPEAEIDIVQRLSRFHWRALELAATVKFFEQTQAVADRAEALLKALKMKPACAPYEREADSVLEVMCL